MLYFSKIKIISILIFSICISYLAFSNFVKFDDKLIGNKINLGLDLQGGSYLLLEIDNSPVIEQKLQNLTITIKNYFKEKNIRINNLKISNQELSFTVDKQFKQTVLDEFINEESNLNPYYPRFKSHQLNIEEKNDLLIVSYSKQGLVELKTSSQDQALELSLIHI